MTPYMKPKTIIQDTVEGAQVYLTDDEARLFVRFQKYHALIQLLESVGAFDIRGGSLTLHFGGEGDIKSIDKHQYYHT